jgi:16S rRNA (cytosine967-C5)-methyltransferase
MSGASKARTLALDVITRVREREAYAHETLDSALGRGKLQPREVAQATRLAYGTISCRGTLDEVIARFVSDIQGLEPKVGDALALSVYELLFMRTPARAAVSEGVELARSVRPRTAGLANAVLRKVADAAAGFPWGDPTTDVAALARLHGHPEWMVQMWVDELGVEAATSMLQADDEPAPLYVAHLPFQNAWEVVLDDLSRDGVDPQPCPVAGCILAGSSSAAVKSMSLRSQHVIVADAAAQFAAAVVRSSHDQTIIELGAGRGTKSLLLAAAARLTGGRARIIAVDSHAFKLEALSKTTTALSVDEIETVVADATNPEAPGMPPLGTADAVLVDAPCSGLGTLRRHPDRRWRARPEEIPAVAALGAGLLRAASSLVKVGGFVVYSTCTVASVENAQVVEAFLLSEEGVGFSVDSLAADVPDEWGRFVTPQGYFQSLPERGGPDGHFIARLRRDS